HQLMPVELAEHQVVRGLAPGSQDPLPAYVRQAVDVVDAATADDTQYRRRARLPRMCHDVPGIPVFRRSLLKLWHELSIATARPRQAYIETVGRAMRQGHGRAAPRP